MTSVCVFEGLDNASVQIYYQAAKDHWRYVDRSIRESVRVFGRISDGKIRLLANVQISKHVCRNRWCTFQVSDIGSYHSLFLDLDSRANIYPKSDDYRGLIKCVHSDKLLKRMPDEIIDAPFPTDSKAIDPFENQTDWTLIIVIAACATFLLVLLLLIFRLLKQPKKSRESLQPYVTQMTETDALAIGQAFKNACANPRWDIPLEIEE